MDVEVSLDPNINLEQEIARLRREKNAVILAHYYQDSEIQDVADFIGDSLDLSRKAAATDADIIVFCGVTFMADVAKILNPTKKVLVPDLKAGCSLEDSCKIEQFEPFVKKHENHIVLTYINSSVEVKAISDVIVTSSNAEKIIRQIPESQPIIFGPDKFLGGYLSRKTGRDMLLWQGTCIVHERFSEVELVKLKTRYESALVVAHPECPEALLGYADHIGSTSSLINFVKANDGAEFIVLTEPGIIHQMQKAAPKSKFYGVPGTDDGACASCNSCPYMRLNSLEKLYLCLLNETPEIKVDIEVAAKAKKSIDKMLEMSV